MSGRRPARAAARAAPVALLALLGLAGCATAPGGPRDYDAFFQHHPRSILVVPPANRTTAVDAPAVFGTTITRPLAERGYYVFPTALSTAVLRDLGLTDEGLVASAPPQRFREVFGADAVLFVTITSWTTTYVLVQSSVTVDVAYRLVDTATGTALWERTQRISVQSRGGNLIELLVNAAANAIGTDYRPLAQQANALAVGRPAAGLPAGPYRDTFQKDYDGYR